MLRSPLQPVLRSPLSSITNAIRRQFPWSSLFQGVPGFRINIEESLRLNQQAMGPELLANGGFDDGLDGWVQENTGSSYVDWVAGEAVWVIPTAGQNARLRHPFVTKPGQTYVVSVFGAAGANVAPSWFIGSTSGAGDLLPGTGSLGSRIFTATTSETWFNTASAVAGAKLDNVSVREIDLSKCVAFQDSAGTLPVTAMEQPLGYIKDLSGHGNHFVQPSNTASRPIVSRRVNLLTATTTLATQSVTTLAASHVLAFSGTGSVTLSGTATGTYSAGTHTITTTAGTLTVTVSGLVTNADLRLSIDSALPYQRVTSSTDYDEAGFPAYARFDGLDDWLESAGTVDMTSTDEVTVLAGVTKLSDPATAVILELSTSSANNGAFGLYGPTTNSSVLRSYAFSSRGTLRSTAVTLDNSTYPAPHKSVLTGIGRISTDTVILRVNGTQVASDSADQGTGNYTAHKFYMGRRGGASLPFNGRIYGVTVIGKLLDDSTLARAEQAERQLGRLY